MRFEGDQTKAEKIYELVLEYGIATEEEIKLVTDINGFNVEALNDIIWVKTGYRYIEQYIESEGGAE